jgi:hypothetical protein
MDAEGSRTFLPRYLKVAEWRAQGKSVDEIKRLVADAFAKGIFQAPTKPSIDYMLSTERRNYCRLAEEPFPAARQLSCLATPPMSFICSQTGSLSTRSRT